jgi:hypothetical protein
MAERASIRTAVIAVLLGSIWPFVLAELFAFSGSLTVALAQAVTHLGSAGSVRLVVRSLNAIVWALALGVMFGIPLGLAARSYVIAYWFAFVASILITSAALALHSGAGLGILLLEWSFPETWINVVAVLCFARWAARLRARRERVRVVAP